MSTSKKYIYKITIKNPETENISTKTYETNTDLPTIMVPVFMYHDQKLSLEEARFIVSVEKMTNAVEMSPALVQCEQVVLNPGMPSTISKRFAHILKDLHITDEDYDIYADFGHITENENTILISPKGINKPEGMKKYLINSILSTLNLQNNKILTVNYITKDVFEEKINTLNNSYTCECDDCEESCCNNCDKYSCEKNLNPDLDKRNHAEIHNECPECDDYCKCKNNPDDDCCKSCDQTEDCGCYIKKRNRDIYVCNKSDFNNLDNSNLDNNDQQEKYIKIPIDPINPRAEIVQMAYAISKRLEMILDPDETEASVIIKKVYDYENSKYKNILKILRQNILDI